jgi:phosphomannomutase
MLIRASNTSPVIKINSEGKTQEKMREKFELAKVLVEEGIRDHEDPNH